MSQENETKAEFCFETEFPTGTIWLEPSLFHRIARLLNTPRCAFDSYEGFLIAAVYSFVKFKENMLRREGYRLNIDDSGWEL